MRKRATSKLYVKTPGTAPEPGMAAVLCAMSMARVMPER